MVKIRSKKYLELPLPLSPEGDIKTLDPPKKVGLDVSEHVGVRFQLLKKEGENVLEGEPVLQDKHCPVRQFVAPIAGKIVEIQRGEKRRILTVVIERGEGGVHKHTPLEGENLPEKMAQAGLFAYIRKRPTNTLPDPNKPPEAIFVKGLDTAPYSAPSSMELSGKEPFFEAGLNLLKGLAPVHVVTEALDPMANVEGVEWHTANGRYPICSPSLHIYSIRPITDKQTNIWTLDFSGVIAIGMMKAEGKVYNERVFGVGGLEERGFYRGALGHPVEEMGLVIEEQRIISGNPLMGREVGSHGFLGFTDRAISAISQHVKPQFLHFCRPGFSRFTATRTYLSALFKKKERPLNTQIHGEERAFVDADVYQKVMPMQIPVMELVKAIMAQDYDLAEELGILEVAPEDFALPTFVCPSKIPMIDIVSRGLRDYSEQVL